MSFEKNYLAFAEGKKVKNIERVFSGATRKRPYLAYATQIQINFTDGTSMRLFASDVQRVKCESCEASERIPAMHTHMIKKNGEVYSTLEADERAAKKRRKKKCVKPTRKSK